MIYSEVINLSSTNKILLEVLDGRSVRLTITADSVNTVYTGQKISVILINNKPYLSLDSLNNVYVKINEEVQVYKIVEILNIDNKKSVFQLNTAIRSKSSYFITPLVIDSKETMRWNQYFINSYLLNIDTIPELGIVYRFFNTEDYKKFELQIRKLPNFLRSLEPDYQYSMFIFKFPEEHYDDLQKFFDGRYSVLSVTAKKKILSFNNCNEDSILGQILYKSPVRKKQFELDFGVKIHSELELYDKPKLSEEVFYEPAIEGL